MNLMEITALEKRYNKNNGLHGVTMSIPAGQIIGLLGPNGSGKTTLLKTIAGLLQPDKGQITYPSGAQRGVEAKKTIAFLPDTMVFPSWMKVKDVFTYYEDMYPDYSRERANQLIQLLELDMEESVKKLSKGMQERVALAATFSRETSLYLLDEPLGGIDPVGKMKVLDSILSMDLEHASIVLSTHLVKDVETIFDSYYFLANGKIIGNGSSEELRETSGKTVEDLYLEVFANVKTI